MTTTEERLAEATERRRLSFEALCAAKRAANEARARVDEAMKLMGTAKGIDEATDAAWALANRMSTVQTAQSVFESDRSVQEHYEAKLIEDREDAAQLAAGGQ